MDGEGGDWGDCGDCGKFCDDDSLNELRGLASGDAFVLPIDKTLFLSGSILV
jgi:hypothetical protein